jgi:hypothetical protein
MSMTGSFLTRAIADFRRYSDEPSVNAKYTDTVLAEMIEQSYAHIISEVNRNSTEPIVATFDVTYVDDTSTYLLPCVMGAISAIYYETDSGYRIFFDSRSNYNPAGRGIHRVGNVLKIQSNILADGDVITIEYLPSGTVRLHNGTCTVDSTGKLVTFGATASTGTLDTHANAYAGCIFRIVSSDQAGFDFVQERNIVSYVNTTRVATLDLAVDPNPESTGVTSYEIAPAIYRGLDHAVALYLAYWVASIEGSITRARLLRNMWRDALRNLRLEAYYSNLVDCRKMRADNFDRSRFSGRHRVQEV